MVSSSSSRVVIGLLVAASSLAVALSSDGGATLFSYDEGSPDGPQNWGKLSPAYKLCAQGENQSPIDIVTKEATLNPDLAPLNRTYASVPATLVNDGHDIKLTFGTKVGTITVNGKEYSLDSLHWHSPSDHAVNGQRYPLEIHLVHKSDDGAVAVIGILYQLGSPDTFYFLLKHELEAMAKDNKESHIEVRLIHLRLLQNRKEKDSYFRYTGSLTVPPCTENVVWSVLGEARHISKEQLDLVKAALPGEDSRPLQPLNGRKVELYNPNNSTISFEM